MTTPQALHILISPYSHSLSFSFTPFPSLSPKLIFNSIQWSSYMRSIFNKQEVTLLSLILTWFPLYVRLYNHRRLCDVKNTWSNRSSSAVLGRQRVRFKRKQMFCVSVPSEMKKTCHDWQWREHAQLSHPRNSFLCHWIRTAIARLPASDLSYDGDILPWQLRFWQSQ